MTLLEKKLLGKGYKTICGVDEAGRGPLAGPVVACACIFHEGLLLDRLNDSKKLTPLIRKDLYHKITQHKDSIYNVAIVDADKIDQINILEATLLAMKLAVEGLEKKVDFSLIDGNKLPNLSCDQESVIKGDSLSISIAAASIIAKHERDLLMEEYHLKYPEYGFKQHKGYGTLKHRQAIKEYGFSPIHRKTFTVNV